MPKPAARRPWRQTILPCPKRARADPAGLAADPSGTERGSYRMQDRLVWPVIAAMLVAIAIVVAIVFVV